MNAVGRLFLALALLLALAAVVLLAAAMRSRRHDLQRLGLGCAYGIALTTLVSSAVLLVAFLEGDATFAYVLENSDPSLSVFYRIAGFWAGQQGSFLLWLLLLAGATAVLAVRSHGDDRLGAGAVMVLSSVCACFAALMVIDAGSDPFVAAAPLATPAGLNPLLLHPAMVLHPPALFLGYAGLAVPFAFALSALGLRQPNPAWVVRSHRWAVGGWLFLSLGIALGAWWAYVILSWGGYWGWDPVENTSLIPWLTATALLHSLTLYRRRGVFKRWALSLAVVTFWLTLVATWTTRSGVISSVHAFERRNALLWVLTTFLLAVAVVGTVLIVRGRGAFSADRQLRSLVSRDFLFQMTVVGLTLFGASVLFGTVAVPLALGQTVRPDSYELLARPLGVLTLLLIGVCPLLDWDGTAIRPVLRRIALPSAAAGAAMAAMAATGWGSSVRGLVGLSVCVFAGAAVVQTLARREGAAVGRRAGLLIGLRRILSAPRSRLAGLIAHLGMALVVAGLLGTTVYRLEQRVTLPAEQGSTVRVGDYELTFKGFREDVGPQRAQRLYAVLNVEREGRSLGSVTPRLDYFAGTGQTAARAVILGDGLRDLFVSPEALSEDEVTLQVDVFPLVRLLWAGSGLLVAGAALSFWPRRRVREQTELAPTRPLEERAA